MESTCAILAAALPVEFTGPRDMRMREHTAGAARSFDRGVELERV
ncbi:hypothetical protein [Nocardia albiluteola]|nr:hypothetical protein [Nocardia albiluteola]